MSVVRLFLLGFFLTTGFLVKGQSNMPPILDFASLEPYLHKSNDTTYVVNFWATWCKPCVEELPYFEKVNTDFASEKVKVLLVSMDFKNQIEKKLIPFIEEEKISSEVLVLHAPNANEWIDKVDERWTGALPATIVYRNDQKIFHGEQFENYQQLNNLIKSLN